MFDFVLSSYKDAAVWRYIILFYGVVVIVFLGAAIFLSPIFLVFAFFAAAGILGGIYFAKKAFKEAQQEKAEAD